MRKYLDEMTERELINLAMEEGIFLDLHFSRESTIAKLVGKGYERKKKKGKSDMDGEKAREKKILEIGNIEKSKGGMDIMKEGDILKDALVLAEKIENDEKIEELDFSKELFPTYRSRNYYRNYPNRKLMRNIRKIHRGYGRNHFKVYSFNYKEIDDEQIKRREVETEINRSKFAKGVEYEGRSKKEDIYFDKAYLPNSYFVDEVVLMPKNPTTLFVYWEIRDDTFESLSKNKGIVDNIIIKLFKAGEEYKKIVRHERIGSHYITEVDASQNYEVFLGYEDEHGNFSEVAHSYQAIVPSDRLSDNFDLLWGTVKEDVNTNQIIKYVNSPISTPENIEFVELLKPEAREDEGEFTVEVLERLMKIGASEQLVERRERKTRPERLIMTGVRSS